MPVRSQLFGVAIAALLAGSIASASAESVIRFVPYADLKVLDPIWTTGFITRNHGYLVYDTLFGTDENNQIKPQMVEAYTVSDDGLTWTFTLRDGLRFHDGSPVRPEDCIASIRRWGQRDTAGQALMALVADLRVEDERSFSIILERPYGYVLDSLGKLSSNVPFIMREQDASIDAFEQVTEIVGSGPFKFEADLWEPGNRVVYTRFDDYLPRDEPPSWTAGGKVAKVDRVEWVYVPDGNTAAAALLSGQVDWVEQPFTDFIPLLESDPEIVIKAIDPLGSFGNLRPNSLHHPFDTVEGRQALLHMVDQGDYMQAVLGGDRFWQYCASVYGCGTPYEGTAPADVLVSKNLDKARELLQASGYDGRPIVVLNSTDVPWTAAMAIVTAENLRAIGANVEVRAMDLSTMLTVRARKDPPEEGGWHIFHTWGTVTASQNPLGHSSLRMNGDDAWFGWPADPLMEEYRAAWLNALDDEDKDRYAALIQERAFEVVPYVTTGQFSAPTAYRASLDGIITSPVPLFWNIEKN
jgi:peptide/nickel transport system substrate-binding protein